MLINKKQLLYTRQYGSGIGSFFKNIANSELFKTSLKNIKDGALSVYNNMIKPRLELVKNRGIEYGKEFIDLNRKELDDVFKNKKSVKEAIGNNKRYIDRRGRDLLNTLITGKGLKILK